jgi:formylglycine-generating enzyme required for sulfatase activity
MCDVPAGTFWMGCNEEIDQFCNDDEYPYHEVYLDEFEIDMFEVTQGQYYLCVLDGACEMPACCFDPESQRDKPVVGVPVSSVIAFCSWAGKRLCTEAEWEKAARGTDGRRYPWGNNPATCEYAVMDDGGDGCGTGAAMPVGSRPLGASPYGPMDMAGNVEELVADCYSPTYYNECTSGCANPQNTTDCINSGYVQRGGAFWGWASVIRTSSRAGNIGVANGFRCCR